MDTSDSRVGRRQFVGMAAAAAAGVMFVRPGVVRGSSANSAVRLGLLGCGGRGLSVAGSLLEHTDAVVTAAADVFQDSLDAGKKRLDTVSARFGKPAIDPARLFRGLQAYEALMASPDIDAVVIATPPYFHPAHLEAAIAAGRHVYLEKPVAVDVPGAKKVIALGARATGRLSLAVGFQIRHASAYVELARRMREGQIGQPVSGQTHYFASALNRPDWPDAAPAARRLRNWVHDKTLSGDIIVEQNIHVVDVTNWLLQGHPLKATGTCGRAARTDQGDCSGHFNCVFTYPGNVHIGFASTQFGKASFGVGMQYYGTKGCAEARYDLPVRIAGETAWDYPGLGRQPSADPAVPGPFRGALYDADRNKAKAFVDSITSGVFLNEATSGAESTLAAILGRTAAYTGKEITWEKLLKSKDAWNPRMDWKGFT